MWVGACQTIDTTLVLACNRCLVCVENHSMFAGCEVTPLVAVFDLSPVVDSLRYLIICKRRNRSPAGCEHQSNGTKKEDGFHGMT